MYMYIYFELRSKDESVVLKWGGGGGEPLPGTSCLLMPNLQGDLIELLHFP